MAYNGGVEVKEEYTEEYQTEYVETAEYQELVGLGLDEQVARELDELFQSGEHCLVVLLKTSLKLCSLKID